ncbi:MAG: VWA domain-containing protein [Anaerolineales bacterium]|nr:VWA domain-containing protein [Anaerolineales bacterium]
MERKPNFYRLLGLSKDATPEEIRRAYHEAVLRLHPDVNINPGDTELFLGIQNAFEVLSDPHLRVEYDRDLPPHEHKKPINLEVLYSQSRLLRSDEPQLIYALISLIPAEDSTTQTTLPLNICLVLDRSTSMQGERLDNLKKTAIRLARELKEKGSLSIVTFSDRAEVLLPSGANREIWEIESAIHLLQSAGGTEIFQGLKAAVAEVYRRLDNSAVNHIVLVTDGRTYGDEQASLELANIAARRGVAITCLGIGSEWNDVFLDKLATASGGSSAYVADSDEIEKNLQDIIKNLSQSLVSEVALHGRSNPNVELTCAFRLHPKTGELLKHDPIYLGNLPNNGNLDILLEFLVHPSHEKHERVNLFSGRINYQYVHNLNSLDSMFINLNREHGVMPTEEKPPEAIVRAVERLTLYRMQETAYLDINAGNLEPAIERLEYLASRLVSIDELELSKTILDEVANLKKGLSISASSKKRIKYGTRALLLSGGQNIHLP